MNKLAILASVALGANAANAAVYTFSNTWKNSVDNTISGGAGVISQNSSTTITSKISVPILDVSTLAPGEFVVGVQIRYQAPQAGQSPDIVTSTSVGSGSSTFTALSASVTTNLTSTDVAGLLSAYTPYDLLFSNPYVSTDQDTGAPPNNTIDVANPWTVTLTRTYDIFRLNQPANGGMAGALTTNGSSGSVSFNVDTVLTSQFTREAAGGEVLAHFLGTDSGRVSIIYTTAIPEPSGAALLGLIGVGALLRRRRFR